MRVGVESWTAIKRSILILILWNMGIGDRITVKVNKKYGKWKWTNNIWIISINSRVPNVGNFDPVRFMGKVCRISQFLCKKAWEFQECCHGQKQLLHGQIFIFCWQIFKAVFDIVHVVFADDNMHFRIPRHCSHKKSPKRQTLPMNRADLR